MSNPSSTRGVMGCPCGETICYAPDRVRHLGSLLPKPIVVPPVTREQVIGEIATRARTFLEHLHATMIDDASERMQAMARAAASSFMAVGLLTEAEVDGWRIRFTTCPEIGFHLDPDVNVAGRGWCAYCGNLPERTIDRVFRKRDEAAS